MAWADDWPEEEDSFRGKRTPRSFPLIRVAKKSPCVARNDGDLQTPENNQTDKTLATTMPPVGAQRTMKMAPCPATSGSWQVLEVLGDGGLGEGPSFKKGLPLKMHFHRNQYKSAPREPTTFTVCRVPRGSAIFSVNSTKEDICSGRAKR